ncbi:MAG: M48 family metallopeptidase [Rickettsiales bacterium]|nr:M48 family metallopeptidase [Rickettsiales bacterium]
MSTGEAIPIEIITRKNTRSITIRPKFSPKRKIAVSRPWHTTDATIKKFLESKMPWIEKNFAKNPHAVLCAGDKVKILGKEVVMEHATRGRQARAIQKIFEAYAKKQVAKYSVEIGKKACKITIRDTSSRWGSCSVDGSLSFSFRLAFAPESVARYIIAHEMAHLLYFDHSPKFWACVGKIYGSGWKRQKDWLAKNGQSLYKYL